MGYRAILMAGLAISINNAWADSLSSQGLNDLDWLNLLPPPESGKPTIPPPAYDSTPDLDFATTLELKPYSPPKGWILVHSSERTGRH